MKTTYVFVEMEEEMYRKAWMIKRKIWKKRCEEIVDRRDTRRRDGRRDVR